MSGNRMWKLGENGVPASTSKSIDKVVRPRPCSGAFSLADKPPFSAASLIGLFGVFHALSRSRAAGATSAAAANAAARISYSP